MEFFPLSEDVKPLQEACWEAQDAIANAMNSILAGMAETMAKADMDTETAFMQLFRRMKSAVGRGCKPIDKQIQALFDQILQRLNQAIEIVDQQINAVKIGLQDQVINPDIAPPGWWWFDDDNNIDGGIAFVAGPPKPPPFPGVWVGPYGTKEGAQNGWKIRQPPPGTPPNVFSKPPLPITTTQPLSNQNVPAVPQSESTISLPGMLPPSIPPTGIPPLKIPTTSGIPPLSVSPPDAYSPPSPPIAPPSPPIAPPSQEPVEQQSPPPANPLPVAAALAPATPARAVCGINPSTITQIVGNARVPVAWTDTEMADIESECGEIACQSARGQMVPVSMAIAAISAGDASAAWGESVARKPVPSTVNLPE